MPLDPRGLVRVDPNTAISLELVQNVTSYNGSAGDEVWFRVTRDLGSSEGVWLREGTPVRGILYHVEGRWSSARGGVLDVVIPAVVAVDGTVAPTLGEVVEQGGKKYSKGGRVSLNVLRAM